MLNSQKSPSDRLQPGFNKTKASTIKIKQVKFVKPVEVLAADGSLPKGDESQSMGSMDPPDSKNGTKHDFKPIASSQMDFVVVTKKAIQNATENTIKQPLKPSIKNGLGFVKTESIEEPLLLNLGYSQNSKAYINLIKHTMKIKESLNVTFDEIPPPTKSSPLVDDDVGGEKAIENQVDLDNNLENETLEDDLVANVKESKNYPLDKVIGRLNERSNYGVTCEDEAKRRNSKAEMKTFEENYYLLLYAVSSKEDTAYQRQLITRIRTKDQFPIRHITHHLYVVCTAGHQSKICN
ncbi:hypothetical protein Tco_0178963 [Tanacetum coccineum]